MNLRVHKLTIVLVAVGVLTVGAGSGCVPGGGGGWVDAGDFYTPTVEPADFSPYGYDYSMYDIFTSDL